MDIQIFLISLLIISVNLTIIETNDLRMNTDILEDATLDTFTMIRKYGYPCQIHRVYTEDEYILEMHRVPYGRRNDTPRENRPIVFLQHGLLSSSAEWVLMTPEKGFAYFLAEAGYDVWMGNARGNTYSRRHVTMKPDNSQFWQFSWHEIGYYDVPAMIDYVLKETGMNKLHYIGFSQGTTVFWVMTSTRPEYNDKIISMQALAPIGYVSNIKSPLIRAIGPFTNSLERIMKLFGAHEFLPNGEINNLAGQKLCTEEAFTQFICKNMLFLLCGFNEEQLNTTMLPIVMGHTPAGSSTKQVIHFGQLYKSGQFRQFDHGWLTNRLKYGSYTPPPYNLTAIRTPIYMHYADNDWLSTPPDVHKLTKEIPTVIAKLRIPMAKFNHLDFVFAINATNLVYSRVLNIMKNFD